MKLTQSNMFPRWRTPARKAFTPEGFTLGAEVRFSGRTQTGERIRGVGQVWVRADIRLIGPRSWWIVDAGGIAALCHEDSMTVLGQCADVPLPLEETA